MYRVSSLGSGGSVLELSCCRCRHRPRSISQVPTQQLKKVPTNHVCGVTHSRSIPCQSPSPGSCFSGGSLTAGLRGKRRVDPFAAAAMRGVNLSLSTLFRQRVSPQRLARQASLYPASYVAAMATTHGSSTTSSPPWYAAYPPPRHLQPGCVTREELLSMLKDGENVTANDFVLVDLRRADHEVSCLVVFGAWQHQASRFTAIVPLSHLFDADSCRFLRGAPSEAL